MKYIVFQHSAWALTGGVFQTDSFKAYQASIGSGFAFAIGDIIRTQCQLRGLSGPELTGSKSL